MSRALLVLSTLAERARAHAWIKGSKDGTRVEFKAAKRTLPQNDLMWKLLTEVSLQAEWHGKKRPPVEWKDLFTASLKSAAEGLEIVPGLTGGIMLLGLHTSDMEKEEMSALIEWIYAWSADNGVVFSEPAKPAEQARAAA